MNALINLLVTTTATGAAWLLVWSWQAAVLLACVWVGLKIFRVKSPALRHQVWLVGLIAVVAIPVLSSVVQNLPLPQPNNKALSYAVELPRIVVTNDAAPVSQVPSPAVSVKPSIKQPVILSLLFAFWLIGASVFALRAVSNSVRLRRLKADARLISLADLDCDEHDCEALRAGNVSLALSDEIRSPILAGVLRPMIVLPADIASWTSPVERGAMLRHELAHVARRDHYVNLFQTILGAVFFFHPLVRYACRQLEVEREMACDDHVVGSGAEAEVYAESIIKVAERSIALAGAPSGAHQLALFSARQILERRIEMILNRNRVRAIVRPWKYLLAPVGLIACVVWLLIPATSATPGLAQSRSGSVTAPISADAESVLGHEKDQDQKNEVCKLLVEVMTAYITRKTSFFESILADDYFGIDPKGNIHTKAQQIDDLKKLKSHFGMSLDSNFQATRDGNLAVGAADLSVYPDNGDPTEEYRFTVTFVRRKGQWKVLSIHVSRKQ